MAENAACPGVSRKVMFCRPWMATSRSDCCVDACEFDEFLADAINNEANVLI